MLNNKSIGLVILNYNDFETTIKLLKAIEYYTIIDHIVIVDNLSTDTSFKELLKYKNSKIDVLQTDVNGGYSYGNNFGAFYLIKKYNIDILFIANPDVEFSEEFIIKCSEILNKNMVQAISGKMLDHDGKISKYNYKINSYFEDLIDSTLFLRKIILNNKITYAKRENDYIYVDFLPGSLFAINAKVFKEIEGFDSNVFLYYEETILSLKLKNKGYKLAISSNISFKHIHSVSINKSIKKINQLKQLYKSRLYLYENYFKISRIKLLLLKLFMTYGIFTRKIIYKFLY